MCHHFHRNPDHHHRDHLGPCLKKPPPFVRRDRAPPWCGLQAHGSAPPPPGGHHHIIDMFGDDDNDNLPFHETLC